MDTERQEGSSGFSFVLRFWEFTKVALGVIVIASLGMVTATGVLSQKHLLEQKMFGLQKENERLRVEIRMLERDLTLLRDNPRAIEKAAESKLGMARPDETVYLFESNLTGYGQRRPKQGDSPVRLKAP